MKKIILSIMMGLLLFGCAEKEPLYPVEQDTGFMYERQQLNEVEKEDYDELYESVMEMEKSVELNAKDDFEIEKIYEAVLNDHPEMFWIENSMVDYEFFDDYTDIQLHYGYTPEVVVDYQNKIEAAATQILAGLSSEASDYDKVMYVYDYLIDNTTYENFSLENQNILSVLLYNESVCAGYARTMQYLLEKVGVDTSFVSGKVLDEEGTGHAWNMVKMDDEYYYMDVTSGDGALDIDGAEIGNKTYAFFGMTSDEMLAIYEPDTPYEDSQANANNYYVKVGAYFDTIDGDKLYQLLSQDTSTLSIKCSDSAVYDEMKAYLLDQYEIFDLLSILGAYTEEVYYVEYKEVNVITFDL